MIGGFATFLGDHIYHSLTFFFSAAANNNFGTFCSIQTGDSNANPAGRAGNNGNFVFALI